MYTLDVGHEKAYKVRVVVWIAWQKSAASSYKRGRVKKSILYGHPFKSMNIL